MADKILQTRIKLKYDTLKNWESEAGKSLVLLKGEIGIVEVPSQTLPDGTVPAPQILFKVGNGTTPFKDLNWTSGLSADVFSWAKKSGIEVTDATTGNFLTDVKWEGDKLVLTRGTVVSTITPTVTDDDVIIGVGTAGNNGFTLDLKHAEAGPSNGYTKAASTKTISGSGATGIIKIPQIKVDKYGHVNEAADETISITMPTIPVGTGNIPTAANEVVGSVKLEDHTLKGSSKKIVGSGSVTVTGSASQITIDSPHITVTPNIPVGDHPQTNEVVVLSNISASKHTITQTGVKVPTKKYVDDEITKKVSGAVQYLGLLHSIEGLNHEDGNPNKPDIREDIGKGDFYRVASDFIIKMLTEENQVQFEPIESSPYNYKVTRVQRGFANLVGIHDDNGLHRFDEQGNIRQINASNASYEFDDGSRIPLESTQTLSNAPVLIPVPTPKDYPGQFVSLHPGDLLVAAVNKPEPKEFDETLAESSSGYYVVHGEEIGVVDLQAGAKIDILNPNSSSPTIAHEAITTSKTDANDNSVKIVSSVKQDGYGHTTEVKNKILNAGEGLSLVSQGANLTYSLKRSTDSTIGGGKAHPTEKAMPSGKNYAVQIDNTGKYFVAVPWQDVYNGKFTVTGGNGLTGSGFSTANQSNNTSVTLAVGAGKGITVNTDNVAVTDYDNILTAKDSSNRLMTEGGKTVIFDCGSSTEVIW